MQNQCYPQSLRYSYFEGQNQDIRKSIYMENTKLPYGSLVFSMCKVNEVATKNCTTMKNLDDLEISDVLESIKLLLNYIRKRKRRELR